MIIIAGVLVGLLVIVIILIIVIIVCLKKSQRTKVVPFEEGGQEGFKEPRKPSPPPSYSSTDRPPTHPSAPDQSNQPQVHVVGVPIAMTQTTPNDAPPPPPIDSSMPLPPAAPVLYLPPPSGNGMTEISA